MRATKIQKAVPIASHPWAPVTGTERPPLDSELGRTSVVSLQPTDLVFGFSLWTECILVNLNPRARLPLGRACFPGTGHGLAFRGPVFSLRFPLPRTWLVLEIKEQKLQGPEGYLRGMPPPRTWF